MLNSSRLFTLVCLILAVSTTQASDAFLQKTVLKLHSTNEELLKASSIEADVITTYTCMTGFPFLRTLQGCGYKQITVKADADGSLTIPNMENPSKYGTEVSSQINPDSYHQLTIRFFDSQSRARNRPLFEWHNNNQEILSFRDKFDGRALWLTPIADLKIDIRLNGSPFLGSQLSQGVGNYLSIYFSVDRNSKTLKNDSSVQGDYDGKSFFIGNIHDRSLAETTNWLMIPGGVVVSFDKPAQKIHIYSSLTIARTEMDKRSVGSSALIVDASNDAMSSIGKIDLN